MLLVNVLKMLEFYNNIFYWGFINYYFMLIYFGNFKIKDKIFILLVFIWVFFKLL